MLVLVGNPLKAFEFSKGEREVGRSTHQNDHPRGSDWQIVSNSPDLQLLQSCKRSERGFHLARLGETRVSIHVFELLLFCLRTMSTILVMREITFAPFKVVFLD